MTDNITITDAINRVAALLGREVRAGDLAFNAGFKLATDVAGAIAGDDHPDVYKIIETAGEEFHRAANEDE
jgi:hypothetical protein